MTAKILEEIGTLAEQRLILPGYYSWEQFEAMESLMADSPGLRITYLDGWIEFMTLGEEHESFKKASANMKIYNFDIKSVRIGIILISLFFICVNLRQSIVIGG
ncbi:hypothetical protein [Microcoleus sp. D2_18a_B4]|uniref:hypothetical protein n=1 Tax=Microcoleus sp. D2_18a_B4 TaxID=3055329 RepID=UPI002FD3F8ED